VFDFVAVPSVGAEEFERNTEHARTLGLPAVEYAGNVAVVGGGLSLAGHLDELRAWKGPIWAINQTFMWLKERGVKAAFLTCDPKPQPWLKVEPGDRALVCLHASPELFASLKDAHVQTFEMGEGNVESGPTTATAAPSLAFLMGHTSLTFFGCDSSFDGPTHVFDCARAPDEILVECGGAEFATKPEFMMQADYLAMFCRDMPGVCSHRSGGLLAQMVETPARRVVGVADSMLTGQAA
jgi:hypothetical protein